MVKKFQKKLLIIYFKNYIHYNKMSKNSLPIMRYIKNNNINYLNAILNTININNESITSNTVSKILNFSCKSGEIYILHNLSKIINNNNNNIFINIDDYCEAIKNISVNIKLNDIIKYLLRPEWSKKFIYKNENNNPTNISSNSILYFYDILKMIIINYYDSIIDTTLDSNDKLQLQLINKNEKNLELNFKFSNRDSVDINIGFGIYAYVNINSNIFIEGIITNKSDDYIIVKSIKKIPDKIFINKEKYNWNGYIINNKDYNETIDAIKKFVIPSNNNDENDENKIKDLIINLKNEDNVNKICKDNTTEEIFTKESVELMDLQKFNNSQREAIKGSLLDLVSLVQGPPGTGKTELICNIIFKILNHYNKKILCVCNSNDAINNIVEKLDKLNKEFIKDKKLIRYTTSKIYKKLQQENSKILEYTINIFNNDEQKRRINESRIICTTCGSSNNQIFDNFNNFDYLIMDEASQTTVPTILIPFMRGCKRLILVGDHHQLPPTVQSEKAKEAGMDNSLFYLLAMYGCKPYVLQTQYRMHPVINLYPSNQYYGGFVGTGVGVKDLRPKIEGYEWNVSKWPISIENVKGTANIEDTSYYNMGEIIKIVEIINKIIDNKKLIPEQIGVITPYKAQVNKLKKNLDKKIAVGTVDAFQGQEKDLIILSTVVSENIPISKFLGDWRRINVSITRAKRGLIIVGNIEYIKKSTPNKNSEQWINFIKWCEKCGLVKDEDNTLNTKEKERLKKLQDNDMPPLPEQNKLSRKLGKQMESWINQ